MKTKVLITSILILVINLCMFTLMFTSCASTPKRSTKKINVKTPATDITQRSEEQKDIADSVADEVPEVEGEMESIKTLANENIQDAEKIIDLQPEIDKKDKIIASRDATIKKQNEEKAKMEKDLKEAHSNTLIRVLSIMTGLGILGVVAGLGMVLFTFYTTQKFNIIGAIIAGCGGAVAGLCILTIMYLKIIAITVGVIVAVIIGIITLIILKNRKADKKVKKLAHVNNQLIDDHLFCFQRMFSFG